MTQLICLGDVASTGSQSREVIKRLREIDYPVMGNMDAWLSQPELRRQCRQDMDRWCGEQLSSVDKAYLHLHTFQPTIEYTFPDGKYFSVIIICLVPTLSVFCLLLQRKS